MKRFFKLMTAVSLLVTVFACYPPDTIEIPVGNPETSNKVKVFIMAGQSNMQGHGEVYSTQEYDNKNGGMGTLEYLVNDSGQSYIYDYLITNSGAWVVRDDVWVVFNNNSDGETVSGPLSVGYGAYAHCIGPELQFGHIVGDRYESQVLIIKEAWGGKSLHVDFRPPSSGGQVGEYYVRLVNDVHDILDTIDSLGLPNYDGQGYEIFGMAWHQGFNDWIDSEAVNAYQYNCVNLINDLRAEFNVIDMPFVIATTGMHETHPDIFKLTDAQKNVPNDSRLHAGNVITIDTWDYWRELDVSPSDQLHHWHRNAESYFLVGNGLGDAMVQLLN